MIIEGHDVEKATEMVDAMQSSRVGAAYLALTVAPATEGKHAQIVHGLLNETVPFLVPVPCLIIRPGQISRDCTNIPKHYYQYKKVMKKKMMKINLFIFQILMIKVNI